jgi:hypothetical protein
MEVKGNRMLSGYARYCIKHYYAANNQVTKVHTAASEFITTFDRIARDIIGVGVELVVIYERSYA